MSSKFVVVSGYFAPIVGGTSTVISNLLRAFDPTDFWVIAEKPDCFDGNHNAEAMPEWRVDRFGVPAGLMRIPYGRIGIRYCRYGLIPLLVDQICIRADEIR